MAKKILKPNLPELAISLISDSQVVLTCAYTDSSGTPIDISSADIHIVSEWRRSNKAILSQVSTHLDLGNSTGTIVKTGINTFTITISDTSGFDAYNGTLDIWLLDLSGATPVKIPILKGTWESEQLTTDFNLITLPP